MNAKQLESAGKFLEGQHWTGPFARRFGLGRRSLNRMLVDAPIPDGLVRDLEIALRDQANGIDDLLGAIAT